MEMSAWVAKAKHWVERSLARKGDAHQAVLLTLSCQTEGMH